MRVFWRAPLAGVLLVAHLAAAYPNLWAWSHPSCSAVPAGGGNGAHGPVTPDDLTTAFVAYSNEDGRPVKEFCPGVAYAVKVFFPEGRLMLAVASVGELYGTADQEDNAEYCMNRQFTPYYDYGTLPLRKEVPMQYALPCTAKPGGSISIVVTSATGSRMKLLQGRLVVPVAAASSCPADACRPLTPVVPAPKASPAAAPKPVASPVVKPTGNPAPKTPAPAPKAPVPAPKKPAPAPKAPVPGPKAPAPKAPAPKAPAPKAPAPKVPAPKAPAPKAPAPKAPAPKAPAPKVPAPAAKPSTPSQGGPLFDVSQMFPKSMGVPAGSGAVGVPSAADSLLEDYNLWERISQFPGGTASAQDMRAAIGRKLRASRSEE